MTHIRRPYAILFGLLIALSSLVHEATGTSLASGPSAQPAGTHLGAMVEVPRLRTRISDTYVQDNHYVAEVHTGSINYQDASGHWQPIDNTLVPSSAAGFATENKANWYKVRFPSDLSNAPVRIEAKGQWIAFQVHGVHGTGTASGHTETYSQSDYSVSFTPDNDVMKESITLNNANAPHSFTYDLRTSPGLTPRQNNVGGIDFLDAKGKAVLAFAAPVMYDSSGGPMSFSHAITLSLSGNTVTLAADPAWINSSARKWPITLDPAVIGGNGYYSPNEPLDENCPLVQQYPNLSYCTNDYVWAGYYSGKYHTLLHFNLGGSYVIPSDAEVLDSELYVYLQTSQYSTTSTTVNVYPVTRSGWTTSATWNKYDGTNAWTTPGGDYSGSVAASLTIPSGAAAGWQVWSPTQMVQSWVNGSLPDDGLALVASVENVQNLMEFWGNGTGTPAGDQPYLRVAYAMRGGEQSFDTTVGWDLSDSMSADVNVTNGNLILSENDLSMDGLGLPLDITRSWNSLNCCLSYSNLSNGWTLGTGRDIGLVPVNTTSPADTLLDFQGPSGYQVPFTYSYTDSSGNWIYTSPPAIDADLVRASTGTYTLTDHVSKEVLHFNSSGLLTSDVDRSGNTLTFTYGTTGNDPLQSITDTQGRSTTFSYTAQGSSQFLTGMTDADGRTYSYGYDPTWTYLTSYTDPNGKTTSFTYTYGNITQITDPAGNITNISYWNDANGIARVSSITRVTSSTSTCPTTGCVTSFIYHTGSTTVTDSNNNSTTYGFDALGRVTSVTDPMSHAWQTSWTSDNQIASQTTPSGHVTTYTYSSDGKNNLTGIQFAGGQTFSWAYTNATWPYQPSSYTDEDNHTWTYGYNSQGLLNSVTDPNSKVSSAVYNSNGTVASTTDVNSHTTTYSYFSTNSCSTGSMKGLLSSVAYPHLSGVASPLGNDSYTYDCADRLSTFTDGKGQKTTYGYDPLDRELSATYADGTKQVYTYDNDGNGLTLNDYNPTTGDSVTSYEYNPLNQLISKTLPNSQQISYTYDGEDNLLSKADNGGTVTYSYNADNTTAYVTDPDNPTSPTSYGYNQDADLTSVALPNGMTESMSYDLSDQLTQITATKAGATINSFTYNYTDPATSKLTTTRYSVTDASNNVTNYTYDPVGRLTSEKLATGSTMTCSGTTIIASICYAYDPVGNMTSRATPSGTTSMTYNVVDELTNAGSTSFTYDKNGSQLGRTNGVSEGYNAQGQTASITPYGGTQIGMTYTGAGQNERTATNGATSMSFAYNDLGIGSSTSGGYTTYYTQGPDGELINERISGGASGCTLPAGSWCTYYYLYDGQGSVATVTDSSGNVDESYSYDPYGSATEYNAQGQVITSDVIPNLYRYIAAVWDSATGLYKMGERYYDPSMGQFTQEDALGGGFTYASSDPIDSADPSGLDETFAGAESAYESSMYTDPVDANVEYAQEGGDWYETSGEDGVTKPGKYAKRSIPLKQTGKRATAKQQRVINRIGRKYGCHRCGTTDPGTKSGNFVLDHQPPTSSRGGQPQRGYPHCLSCSRYQGGRLRGRRRP